MIEYIPRQAAIAAVIEARMPDTTPDGTPIANGKRSVSDCVRRIRDIPAADVQPVKHGRWIDKNPQDKYDPRCICSVCGSVEFPLSRHKYCPNCGAKMDGET